jgi:hypothetical protein
MPSIQNYSIDNVLTPLEDWLDRSINSDSDLFVAALGFEDRASTGFQEWAQLREGVKSVAVVVEYPMNVQDNETQRDKFSLPSGSSIQVIFVKYNKVSMYGEIKSLLKVVTPTHLTVDISVMSSFTFYPLMSAICDDDGDFVVDLYYREAEAYFPKKSEWDGFQISVKNIDLPDRARLFDEAHFQSIGVDDIYESPVFPGRNVVNFPTSLIVVPNFSYERVNRMIDYVRDRYGAVKSNHDWIFGVPPNQDINGWRYEALVSMYSPVDFLHHASTLAYKEFLFTLHQIWSQKHESESKIIASVGSKAQHLATFIFLKMHPEVGLVLSEPKEFSASKYSVGVGARWHLSFGLKNQFIENLMSWNRIVFEWD